MAKPVPAAEGTPHSQAFGGPADDTCSCCLHDCAGKKPIRPFVSATRSNSSCVPTEDSGEANLAARTVTGRHMATQSSRMRQSPMPIRDGLAPTACRPVKTGLGPDERHLYVSTTVFYCTTECNQPAIAITWGR